MVDELKGAFDVLPIACFERIRRNGCFAGDEQCAGDARTRAGCDNGVVSACLHGALESPEHLLSAAATGIANGIERVPDVQDAQLSRRHGCAASARSWLWEARMDAKAAQTWSACARHCHSS